MNLTNKIALGTVQFGMDYGISNTEGMTSDDDLAEILKIAKENNVDTLDTAFVYGSSQKRLGMHNLSSFKVVSKFIPVNDTLDIEKQLEESLKLLNLENLYGFLAHRPSSIIDNPSNWELLLNLKGTGLIEKIGFSFSSLNEVEGIIAMGIQPDLIQTPFNLLDDRFIDYMIMFKEKGCEIHTRSTFLQGLFFCDPEELSDYFNDIKPFLRDLQSSSANFHLELLTYCLKQDYIDRVVLGVNYATQLEENLNLNWDYEFLDQLKVPALNEKILDPSKWPK